MEHRRKIYILLCGVIVTLLFVACSKSGDDELTWYEQIYFNITRSDVSADDEDRTYNFTLFGGTNGNTSYSGTYRLPTTDEISTILYPCQVDATTGLITNSEFNSSYGLYAPAGNYQMAVASPAVAVSSVNDHTDNTRTGFKVDRHIDDTSSSAVDLFIKGPKDVSVSGVEIDGQKEYLSLDEELCRPRSKFVLYICCEDEVVDNMVQPTKYYVYDVYLNNILSTGYYNPTVGYYRGANDVGSIKPYSNFMENTLIATSTSQMVEVNDDYQNFKTIVTETDDSSLDAIYLIANDCSGGESTYVVVPHLVINLNRDANENKEEEASVVTIPLEYEFKRSYYYEFTITISPVGITLSGIAVADWSDGGGDDITVENLSAIVFDWDDVGSWDEGYGGTADFK